VEPAEQEVHAEIREYDREEAEDRANGVKTVDVFDAESA